MTWYRKRGRVLFWHSHFEWAWLEWVTKWKVTPDLNNKMNLLFFAPPSPRQPTKWLISEERRRKYVSHTGTITNCTLWPLFLPRTATLELTKIFSGDTVAALCMPPPPPPLSLSLHEPAVKFLIPIPNIDYKQVLCSPTTPSRQTTIAQQLMCSNAKGCSRQSPAVSERFHDSFWTSPCSWE